MAEYRLVDDRPGLLAMLADVGGAASVAVDAEGCDLGRHGKLCLLQVYVGRRGATCWLVDVSTLGGDAFDFEDKRGSCLRDILEDPATMKLMYDCRQDSDALYHQHGVALVGVYDLQLAEVAARRANGERAPHVYGLRKALDLYIPYPTSADIQASWLAHMDIKELFNIDPRLWDRRPLKKSLQEYAALDVRYMHALRDALHAKIGYSRLPDWELRVQVASAPRAREYERHPTPPQGRERAIAPRL